MKIKIAAVALIIGMFAVNGYAQESLVSNATSVRSSAVLTTADVLSTTFTIPADVRAVDIYTTLTLGSLTNVIISPAGAKDGNPDSSGYFAATNYQKTYTASGTYVIRVPREEFGAYRYAGVFARGTGTVTNSFCQISYKFDKGLPFTRP